MDNIKKLTCQIEELVKDNEIILKDKTMTDKWYSDMIQATDAYLIKKWERERIPDVEQVMKKARRNILLYKIINDDEDKINYNLTLLSNTIFD